MTRAASTITVILIFVLGTWLYTQGEATVGRDRELHGLCHHADRPHGPGLGLRQPRLLPDAGAGRFLPRARFRSRRCRTSRDGKDIGRAKGDVEFDDINFSYDGRRPALVHFSLKVPAGTTVAFVGPTGAGKSTALSLLHRMWDAQSGVIRVDGIDHRDIKLESLRRNIGVVFQDSTMFYRSIADNLRIGKPDATQAELEEAAKLAEAHDFIMRQPQGYETLVGERGMTLSGGERQRLAIARALLKNPPILILDEATSALDSVTEARIQKALKALMQGRTTFVIAHRLSTIRDADQVVVLRARPDRRAGRLPGADGPRRRLRPPRRHAAGWHRICLISPWRTCVVRLRVAERGTSRGARTDEQIRQMAGRRGRRRAGAGQPARAGADADQIHPGLGVPGPDLAVPGGAGEGLLQGRRPRRHDGSRPGLGRRGPAGRHRRLPDRLRRRELDHRVQRQESGQGSPLRLHGLRFRAVRRLCPEEERHQGAQGPRGQEARRPGVRRLVPPVPGLRQDERHHQVGARQPDAAAARAEPGAGHGRLHLRPLLLVDARPQGARREVRRHRGHALRRLRHGRLRQRHRRSRRRWPRTRRR